MCGIVGLVSESNHEPGIGYNTALSFGGLTPLIVSQLMEHGVVYVGVYVALATLLTLFIFAHESSRKTGICQQPLILMNRIKFCVPISVKLIATMRRAFISTFILLLK